MSSTSESVVYGIDDRAEPFEFPEGAIRAVAESAIAMRVSTHGSVSVDVLRDGFAEILPDVACERHGLAKLRARLQMIGALRGN